MKRFVPLGIILFLPLACVAADDFKPLSVKPGLWETKSTTDIGGAGPLIPEEALAKMTPAQRAQMEAAMKAHPINGSHTNTTKSCFTQDLLGKPMTFGQDKTTNCKFDVSRSSSSVQEIHIACGEGNTKSTGVMHIEAVDSENIKGSSEITGSSDGTHNSTIKVSFTSHRLSGDCGDLKPK
jgi:hypothetical protein